MSNKKNISVRLSESDLRRLKDISNTLNVKDSDLFRFAVKSMLSELMPLLRKDLKSIDVLLAILDSGAELLRYFEFDAHQIDSIVNGSCSESKRISMEDIELVSISSYNESYLVGQLKEMGHFVSANDNPVDNLRDYLHKKYIENLSENDIELA